MTCTEGSRCQDYPLCGHMDQSNGGSVKFFDASGGARVQTNERLDRYAEAIRNGLHDSCPNCGGNGWTVENQTWGQPEGEQVQCERCGYLNAGPNPRPGGEGLAASFIARAVMAVADAEQADLRAEAERWMEKAQEAGAAYANANTKHHTEWGRANRLERLADTLAGKAVDLEDRARAAEVRGDQWKDAALKAEAKLAQAWLEGHAAGRDYQGDGWNSDAHDPNEDNPYRVDK